MKTLKTFLFLVLAVILLNSCQQKPTNDKESNKNDSLSTKNDSLSKNASNAYAIVFVSNFFDKIKIFYGKDKTEEIPFPKLESKKQTLNFFNYNINVMVDAFNNMHSKGYDLVDNSVMDSYQSQLYIFRKSK